MVDSNLPLTTQEWEEWGNPNEEKYFDYILSYSPINNVNTNEKYPSCLLTGGLHDSRVQYWEPLKFAAELRYRQKYQDKVKGKSLSVERPVCVKINMNNAHYAEADRYKYLEEKALEYAFLLDQMGLLYPKSVKN